MITDEVKVRIIEAISINRQNYTSDAKHATALGIKTSVYSAIKGGNIDRQLSDANWTSIARRLNVNITKEKDWKIVRTATFEYVHKQLEVCQQGSLSGMMCDIPDIGKTVTAKYYANNNPHVVYVDCSQVKSRQRLIRFIAKEFGVNSTGRYADIYDDLVFYIKSLHNPLVILDEAGDLSYEAYLELKALWNATEHFCGWYQVGADALRVKIERGVEHNKVGFAELKSRHGNKYSRSTPEDKVEREKFMLTQATMIAQANAPEGSDYRKIARKSGGSPRRVYTLITKQTN